MNVIFFGAPGVGKGTYAEIMSELWKVPHISTGAIFREEIQKKSILGKQAKRLMNDGKLVPDNITNAMLKKRLSRNDCKKGFILDGYPRTIPQARFLDSVIHIDRVIHYVATKKTILQRLSGRRTCPKCQKIYHITTMLPKKKWVCDFCATTLIIRDDQKPRVVKQRLESYAKETLPLLSYYESKKMVIEIDSNEGIDTAKQKIIALIQKAILL